MNRTLVSLALVSALVGALTLAATGRSGTEPASCVFLERVVNVRDALTSDGCTETPSADFLGGVHQHLRVWYRTRPDIKIEDLEGIETVGPGCSQESPTVVVCPHRESVSINGYGGRDFIRTGGGSGTSVGADGGRGVDTILGGRGSQRIFGGSRDDTLKGRRGHDSLHGEEGDDLLNGGRGNDRCVSGKGNDRLRNCEYGVVPGDPPRVREP
jgi:RTX calcium-binding nonapeptide repeat (4 copies)